jgi:hypothetical protein
MHALPVRLKDGNRRIFGRSEPLPDAQILCDESFFSFGQSAFYHTHRKHLRFSDYAYSILNVDS